MIGKARTLWRLVSAESGQSLVVVLASLTVLVGMAAFSIDTATWMVKRHHDQVVADAAALAAANCLAHPSTTPTSMVIDGSQTSVPACSTGTDTTAATTVATDYAAANGLAITSSEVHVNLSAGTVNVVAPSTSPGLFARLFGIDQATQAAASTAAWKTGPGACPDPQSDTGCGFLFADDSNCTSPSAGISLSNSGNSHVTGTIISNGNLNGQTKGNVSLGNATYGPGACSNTVSYSGHNPWSSPPTQAPADYPYPVNYATDFPACGGSGETACQPSSAGPLAGYPSFCTNAGANITLTGATNGDSAITDNIYCASGKGQPSNPSSWNGSITISLQGKDTLYDTFVGGTINFTGSGNDVLSACGYAPGGYTAANCAPSVPKPVTTNYPIFYATGAPPSTAPNCPAVLCVTVSGGQVLNGDMFVPNGSASLSMGGNKQLTTFVEAYDISASIAGDFYGDGPTSSGGGGSSGGSDALVQ